MPPLTLPAGVRWRSLRGAERLLSAVLVLQLLIGTLAVLGLSGKPDKVPAAAQPQLKSGLAQWRASWKKLAENPQTKGTLAGVCKQQLEGARASMKAYGCTF